ncbi:MAG: hypothetical protein ACKODT_07080 [Fluviibacter sp.]
MNTVLGESGTMLADTPLGMSIYRLADAITAYSAVEIDHLSTPVGDELAEAGVRLCEMVLDLLAELGVTMME